MVEMTLAELLESLDVAFNSDREGEQSIRCCFPDHDDRHASGRLNLGKGVVFCHTCGQGADVIGLLAKVNGITISQAYELAGGGMKPQRRKGKGFRFKLRRRAW